VGELVGVPSSDRDPSRVLARNAAAALGPGLTKIQLEAAERFGSHVQVDVRTAFEPVDSMGKRSQAATPW
jgi:hypothetical protein